MRIIRLCGLWLLWSLVGFSVCLWGVLVYMSRTPMTLLLPSIAIIIGLRIWRKQELLPDPEQGCAIGISGLLMLGCYGFLRLTSELGLGGESSHHVILDICWQVMIWLLALFVLLLAVARAEGALRAAQHRRQ